MFPAWYTTDMNIRQDIQIELQRCGISQAELGRRSGVLRHRVNEYLTGKREVCTNTLERLLDALEMEIRPERQRARKGETQ